MNQQINLFNNHLRRQGDLTGLFFVRLRKKIHLDNIGHVILRHCIVNIGQS